MYDSKNEAVEFVADTREEAVTKACRFFVADEPDLKIVEPAAGEIFGLGARALIVAVRNDATPPQGGGGGGGDRDRGERRPRDGDRGRGRDRDRDRGRGRDRDRGERADRGDRGAAEREPRPERVSLERTVVEESKGSAVGDVGETGQYVLGVVERMKVGSFEIEESSDGDFVIYNLRGAAAEELGSGDGRTIDALQLLANQAAMRGNEDAPRVIVDAEGESGRREEFLGRLAERAASRSTDSGRAVALDPMNARDRRIIHVTVRDIDDVATMSIGSGQYRQVVVVPKGSPEYDDAVNSSGASRDS